MFRVAFYGSSWLQDELESDSELEAAEVDDIDINPGLFEIIF